MRLWLGAWRADRSIGAGFCGGKGWKACGESGWSRCLAGAVGRWTEVETDGVWVLCLMGVSARAGLCGQVERPEGVANFEGFAHDGQATRGGTPAPGVGDLGEETMGPEACELTGHSGRAATLFPP